MSCKPHRDQMQSAIHLRADDIAIRASLLLRAIAARSTDLDKILIRQWVTAKNRDLADAARPDSPTTGKGPPDSAAPPWGDACLRIFKLPRRYELFLGLRDGIAYYRSNPVPNDTVVEQLLHGKR